MGDSPLKVVASNAKHFELLLSYLLTIIYEMKRIVYRDACAGETNGAWGSRV